MWYSFEGDFVLSGWSHLKALGLPDDVVLVDLPDSDQRSLAGEAFAAPSVAQAVVCFLCKSLGHLVVVA